MKVTDDIFCKSPDTYPDDPLQNEFYLTEVFPFTLCMLYLSIKQKKKKKKKKKTTRKCRNVRNGGHGT